MIKNAIKIAFEKLGIIVKRKRSTHFRVVESEEAPSVKAETINEIMGFFDFVPPFYFEDTRDELKIAGAWKSHLLERRATQIKLIENKDHAGYASLLEKLLQNELISGQWSVAYFDSKLIGKAPPEQFIANFELYNNLTGLNDLSLLDDGNFGGKWGVRVNDSVVTVVDPYKGINAFNAANYLNAAASNRKAHLDFGSGIGSDVIKVSKLVNSPTRFILVDIPLNLTTAYAYISNNVAHCCQLIREKQELDEVSSREFDQHEFIFVPSLYVEELADKIDSIDLMYNHGSFSEMDFNTIKFYMDTLLADGPVNALLEINSNTPMENTGGHIEVVSSRFPIPPQFKLVTRTPSINVEFGHRYVQSLYVKRF